MTNLQVDLVCECQTIFIVSFRKQSMVMMAMMVVFTPACIHTYIYITYYLLIIFTMHTCSCITLPIVLQHKLYSWL